MADAVVSLRPLQVVAESLREVEAGREPDAALRRRTVRNLRAGGQICVPMLVRALRSADERLADWSYFLLARLGGGRVVRELHDLLRDSAVSDRAKGMALALLAELHAPPPAEITLTDPDVVIGRSVRDLLDGLRNAEDVRHAADLVGAQIGPEEMAFFCAELLKHGGPKAGRLVRTIADGDLPDEVKRELLALVANPPAPEAEPPAHRRMVSVLERGVALLSGGEPSRALSHLRRFVRANPGDSEGESCLGICLLELGKPLLAMPHLELACRAEPDEALHQWNLAAAAQKAGRVGRCYLALKSYLSAKDEGPGAVERRNEATGYVVEYEDAVTSDHPGVDPMRLARGEELFLTAFAALEAHHAADAVDGFEKVLRLVPGHYPAWGHLGVAYLSLGDLDQAVECLRRALELKPDYEPALEALEQLTGR